MDNNDGPNIILVTTKRIKYHKHQQKHLTSGTGLETTKSQSFQSNILRLRSPLKICFIKNCEPYKKIILKGLN